MEQEVPVLTAQALVEWRCQQLRIPLPHLPEAAILTHQTSLLGRRWPWQRDRLLRFLSFDTRSIDNSMTLVGCRSIGGPGAAATIEELAVVGVRRLVAIDVCGSLIDSVSSGDVLLATGATGDDGTSRHYSATPDVAPNQQLTDRLRAALSEAGIQFATGNVWSTDAVYRERPSQLQLARQRGASVADMETAATFATAAAVGIEAAAVLVAADELFDTWQPPRDMASVRSQLRRLVDVATAVLRS